MLDDSQKEEVDFEIKDLIDSVKRNFKLFILISVPFSLLSLTYAQFKTKVWEGEFQIVLEKDKNQNMGFDLNNFSGLNKLSSFAGLTSQSNMQTEVGILKSPSTLMPVFEFFKSEKIKLGENNSKLTFKDWAKGKLDIKLTEKTSILNVKYKDTQKDLIIPILEKISNKYKNFSSIALTQDLQTTANYLKGQIKKYDEKSKSSSRLLQEFAIDNGIEFPIEKSLSMKSLSIEGEKTSKSLKNYQEIDNRVALENKIKVIDSQIKKVNSVDINLLPFLFSEYEDFNENEIMKKLNELEGEIALKSAIYRSNDPDLIILKNKKEFLLRNLKNNFLKLLESEKIKSQIYIDTSTKSKEDLIKYRELLKNSIKDEETLVRLENLQTINNLRLAEKRKAWSLITEPTLSPKYIAPNKQRIFILGTVIGLILSTAFCFIKDKKSQIVFDQKLLNKFFKEATLLKLNDYEESKWLKLLEMFISKYDLKEKNKPIISILEVGNLKVDKLKTFKKIISESKFSEEIKIADNIFDLQNSSKIIILTALGSVRIKDIDELKNILSLRNNEIIGKILLY